MHRVIHFELGSREPERAAEFYRKVFGWQVQKWPGLVDYWLVTTGPDNKPGINGGLMRHKDGMPRTVNTIAVSSVEEFAKKVTEHGGKIVAPKMAITGGGFQAYCEDTEENLFGIHQADPKAK